MQSSNLNLKWVLLVGMASFIFLIIYLSISFFNTDTIVVFCDVGQGDGAYIRIRNRFDVVIDAGPDRKILGCLGKYMPFYDHEIELAFMSHPQKDHIYGFIPILDRYKIDRFVISPLKDPSQTFSTLLDKINKKNIPVYFAHAQNIIRLADASFDFYWPTENFLNANLIFAPDNSHFALSRLDDNYFSHIVQFQEDRLKILFTGDIPPQILSSLPKQPYFKTTILKVPHHGSKNGLTRSFLELARPTISIISVGKKNPYGDPSAEIISMLEGSKSKIRRTDIEGDIVFRFRN